MHPRIGPTLRILCGVILAGIVASCGGGGGCSGDPRYAYPATPQAAPTKQAMRARITQSGLDAVAAGAGPLIAAGCVGNATDGTDTCAIDTNPAYHQACDAVCDPSFDTTCTVACDPSVDTTCDPACECAPGCEPNPRVRFYTGDSSMSPDSYLALDTNSLQPNLHVSLVQDAQGGGVQVTVGCNEAQFSNCNDPSQYVTGSLDMVIYFPILGGIASSACFVNEDAPPGFTIKSMRFVMRPRIETDATDNEPHLVLDNADITVSRMKVEFNVAVGEQTGDPKCTPVLCTGTCWVVSGVGWLTEFLFETGVIAEILADRVAGLVLDSFTKNALQMAGALDVGSLLPVSNSHAQPTGFLFAGTLAQPAAVPPLFSPSVTGSTDNLGWNFDFDVGFAGDGSRCVPPINAPAFVLAAPPDVDSTVMAPDPVTGESVSEPYDLALLLGDVVLQRALFELFDTGSLCLDLDGETLAPLTGGSFTPTVATLNLIADGLANLAPDDAPVDIVVVPREPMAFDFGTGVRDPTTGEIDSHFNILWPDLWVEFYPLVDDATLRSTAFSLDLDIGVSLVPAPNGNLGLLVDHIAIPGTCAADAARACIRDDQCDPNGSCVPTIANIDAEGLAPLDTVDLQSLLGVLLSVLISDAPIDVALTADAVGLPFVPKIRAVSQLGPNGEFLGVFLHFCNAAALGDPLDALCYDDPNVAGGAGNATRAGSLAVELIRGPSRRAPATAVVAAFSNVAPTDILELAYRVDGGPWFNFRGADATGRFALAHPRLALPGGHRLSVVARHPGRPEAWSDVVILAVDGGAGPKGEGTTAGELPATATARRSPPAAVSGGDGGCAALPGSIPWLLFGAVPWLTRRRRSRRVR